MLSSILIGIGLLIFLFIGTLVLLAMIEYALSQIIDDENKKKILAGGAVLLLVGTYSLSAGLYLG